nr:hypothetical protein [Dyella sp. ASV24]
MKPTYLLLAASLLAMSANATAGSAEQDCLSYGKKIMKDNPEMLNMLSQVSVRPEDVQQNIFDDNVGTQHVATELMINAHSKQEVFGKILCLQNNDKTLYLSLIHI